MRQFLRGVLFLALMSLFIAGAVQAQLVFSEPSGADLPGSENAAPRLVAGPYVQNVSASSATIMWQSDGPSTAELVVRDGGCRESYRTSRQRRLGEVHIGKLLPDTEYSYTLTVAGKRAEGRFRTFPVADRPIAFVVYGDTRTNPAHHREVTNAIARDLGIEFVLHTGDLVSDARNLEHWIPQFFEPAARLIRSVPVFAVLGNHERNSPNYFTYLSLPGNERWYSFDAGEVHVIALDSNLSFDPGSEQYKWFVSDLTRHKSARWKFVFMHHPTYSSGPHGACSAEGLPNEAPTRTAQAILPGLAKQFGIAAVFAGHDHDYERSLHDGVSYIVTGGGGAPNYADPNAKCNPYRKVFYSGIHYCVVAVDGNRARMIVKTPTGKVIDRTEL